MEIKDKNTLVHLLKERNLKVTFAESLTGGLIASELVSVSGASEVFGYGFVTYSDEAKQRILGVSKDILENQGAVSSECAAAMAAGARKKSGADIAVSVTGFAGPAAEGDNHPAGTVFLGVLSEKIQFVKEFHFKGDRNSVRKSTVEEAFSVLIELTKSV